MAKHIQTFKARSGPIYNFGVKVPRSIAEAYKFDKENGNNLWSEAIETEKDQLLDYNTFKDMGFNTKPSEDYLKISLQWVFAVKHDGRRKARCIAQGNRTPEAKDSSYSGVVSLRSLRIVMMLGEHNGLQQMAGDIGNGYLEANTKEKVYIIAGPEFGELQGHTLIIVKALYGLRSSGARFHDKFADTLRDLGFKPCKADTDVWMKDCGSHYEYVCCYVDDIMAVMKDAHKVYEVLQSEPYNYKLKGVGIPDYYLGGNFGRDHDGTLYWGSSRYVDRMIQNYERMFGVKPPKCTSPMKKGDAPELDDTNGSRWSGNVSVIDWCITVGSDLG